jgi:hypothetical protein
VSNILADTNVHSLILEVGYILASVLLAVRSGVVLSSMMKSLS